MTNIDWMLPLELWAVLGAVAFCLMELIRWGGGEYMVDDEGHLDPENGRPEYDWFFGPTRRKERDA